MKIKPVPVVLALGRAVSLAGLDVIKILKVQTGPPTARERYADEIASLVENFKSEPEIQ